MAAAALEQSILESKDKDTLLEMAKALGVKASARLKKSEIIDKILDTTGSSAAPAPAETSTVAEDRADNGAVAAADEASAADVGADRADDRSGGRDAASSNGDSPAEAATATAPPTDDVLVGPDGEPLADWEIELARAEGAAGGADGTATAAPATEDRQPTAREGDDRGERQRGGQQNRSPQQGGGNQSGGNQNRQGNQSAGNQSGSQSGNQNRNDQSGEGNRRRRRRRKGRNAQDGPQGEDIELIESGSEGDTNEPFDVAGYLDIRDEGYGFLRVNGYLPSKDDVYIPLKIARQYGLRKGDHLTGKARPAGRNEKNPGLLEVYTVNGGDPAVAARRPHFENLTALFPDQKLTLEDPNDPTNMTARIIDLVSPIGKGQRGLIVSPPKAGKTTVMKTIAKSIELNNPEVNLLVLLIDERPEEVTDMRRSVKGEVIASTFDRPSDEHTAVAEMTIAKARRMVEDGKDVVIILDGITRLSRAYNLAAPASGKILSGGIDAGALYPPKKFFGSARNVEEGGSLTILATALVDTNSRMDEAIFEEFKGTGNMELRLDRKVAERRIYPAIDVDASSTRHEELLFDRKQLQQVWKLRRVLSGLAQDGNAAAGLELLIDRLKTFRTNDEFLSEIAKQPGM